MSALAFLDQATSMGDAAQERFAYVLISALPWGQEWQEMEGNVLWRESVQCTMFLYRGDFSDVQLCDVIKPLSIGSPVVLVGAGDGCYAWYGHTHELINVFWSLGVGFGCANCQDTLYGYVFRSVYVRRWR